MDHIEINYPTAKDIDILIRPDHFVNSLNISNKKLALDSESSFEIKTKELKISKFFNHSFNAINKILYQGLFKNKYQIDIFIINNITSKIYRKINMCNDIFYINTIEDRLDALKFIINLQEEKIDPDHVEWLIKKKGNYSSKN